MALINYLTRVHFADRVLEDALAEQMKLLGIRRPLIVTDPVDVDGEPLSRVSDALPGGCRALVRHVTLHDAEPQEVLAGIRSAFFDSNCDGYIALGSETALSLARRAAHEHTEPDPKRRAEFTGTVPSHQRPHLIAIPTTTACVGLQPMQSFAARVGRPIHQGHSAMLPDAILCDPTLTLAQDQLATAATGMDALSHCIEAYLGTTWNPPADGIALDGVRRSVASLDRAVQEGNNLAARREMMAAALNAGLASHKGLGAVEALSRALGRETGVGLRHGYLHAALLPVVMAFNAPAIVSRMDTLRDLLRLATNGDVHEAITALGVRIRLPATLAYLNLDSAARHNVAQRAIEHPATCTNPRLVTASDYGWMLEHAG